MELPEEKMRVVKIEKAYPLCYNCVHRASPFSVYCTKYGIISTENKVLHKNLECKGYEQFIRHKIIIESSTASIQIVKGHCDICKKDGVITFRIISDKFESIDRYVNICEDCYTAIHHYIDLLRDKK